MGRSCIAGSAPHNLQFMKLNPPIDKVFNALLNYPEAKSAVQYLGQKHPSGCQIVRVTRTHKLNRRDRSRNVVVTYGAPNYLERKFIKLAKKAGCLFPISKIQFKLWPIKRS